MALNTIVDDYEAKHYDYPKLMKNVNNGVIVIANREHALTRGIVISESLNYDIGEEITIEHSFNWRDFDGTITLSNKIGEQ